jgi:hypothetical protein
MSNSLSRRLSLVSRDRSLFVWSAIALLLPGVCSAQSLSAPVASPASGVYAEAQNVVLTADAGAEIRYTLNGSEPTQSSTLYTSAINIAAESTTLRAKAFMAGSTPSETLVQTYFIDTIDPVISALVTPVPNAAGWNNTQVTVTFSCSDSLTTVTCPDPVVVSANGEGQIIARTATDAAGNEASASVTINLDLTPGNVSVTSPSALMTTTSDASIAVTGTMADALSGVSTATCNNEPVEVVGGTVECTVALSPGLNSIILHLLDEAGNSSSAGVKVIRTGTGSISSLTVTPGAATMVSGERRLFVASSEYGPQYSGVTWNSSDDMIVEVDSDGTATAAAPGTATLTASSGGISTEVAVTVVASAALALGSASWSLPSPPETTGLLVTAHRVDDEGPDLFKVEYVPEGTKVIAVRADGTVIWTQITQGEPLFGDAFGGLLLWHWNAISRIGGSGTSAPWRYEGQIHSPQHVAQNSDGVVFLTEMDAGGYTASVIGVDGATGQRVFARAIPPNHFPNSEVNCPWEGDSRPWGPGGIGPVAIGADAAAYFEIFVADGSETWICDPDTGNVRAALNSSALARLVVYRRPTCIHGAEEGRSTAHGTSGPTDQFLGLCCPMEQVRI